MKTPSLLKVLPKAVLICALLMPTAAWAQSQDSRKVTAMMIQSYDLLENGKLDAAQKLYEQVLKEHPGQPLALNNLAAVMVKKGKYKEALAFLHQALPQAKTYKVAVNRVCEVNGVCLAFRPLMEVYGNQELEPLVKLNIRMVQGKLAAASPGK
ncbi:MAG: tetratricopeptide repeat protein [Syntrophales bacterium]|nr:tetratricopeptide repeat protein [Syntrophales bacterium]MDD5643230.1 tetratricopeptide repeat protein [Syntrophales bacterium]